MVKPTFLQTAALPLEPFRGGANGFLLAARFRHRR